MNLQLVLSVCSVLQLPWCFCVQLPTAESLQKEKDERMKANQKRRKMKEKRRERRERKQERKRAEIEVRVIDM